MDSRYLGQFERKLALSISNIVVPTCLSLKKDIDLCKLREAVIHVAKNQPNLSHGIAKEEDDKYKFVAPDPNYEYFEVLSAQTDWKELCVKYGNKMLHDDLQNKPPFKVFFIPHGKDQQLSADYIGQVYLIPVYMHFAGDGTNGLTIVKDILSVYEGIIDGTLKYPIFQFSPTVENMAQSAFFHDVDKFKENTIKYEETKKKFEEHCLQMYQRFNYFLPVYEATVVTNVLHEYYLSSCDVYSKFLLKCKEKKVTVGAALTAIQYFAIASFAFQEKTDSAEEIFMGCNIPISLRDRVPLNIADNCVNFSVTQCLITTGIERKSSFWKFVDKIKGDFAYNFNNNFHLFDFAFIENAAVKDLVSTYVKDHGVHMQHCISNMKRFPHSRSYKDFVLESIFCVGGIWIANWDHMELMIYSTDKFNLSFIHRDGIKNSKRAKYVFSLIIYLTENIDMLDESYSLNDLIEKFPMNREDF